MQTEEKMTVKTKAAILFCIIIFLLGLPLSELAATQGEFKEIKKYEEIEKTQVEKRIERPVVNYDFRNTRDPFEGPFTKPPEPKGGEVEQQELMPVEYPPPALTVQGLVWGGEFPQAIINEQVVKIGDTIAEARVISIDKDGVSVFYKEKKYDFPSPAASGLTKKK